MRRTFSDLLIFCGLLLLTVAGSVWLRSTLAAEQPVEPRYLSSLQCGWKPRCQPWQPT